MITYEPKPFLDAAPVNALIHKNGYFAYNMTTYVNGHSFKKGCTIKNAAELDIAHNGYPRFTHSYINALRLNNLYTVHGLTPVSYVDNVFTYSPIDSMAGGVSYGGGGTYGWPGEQTPCKPVYYLWPGVVIFSNVSLHTRLSVALQNVLHHKMQYNILLKQCNVVGVSYRYTRQPVQQSKPVQQSAMMDNVIVVQSRRMSPFAKAYKAIQSGEEVYVKVDNEFRAIGKIH